MVKTKHNKKSNLNIAKLEKELLTTNKKKVIPLDCFPTGCDLLDILVGGGITEGSPAGRILNIVGDKSSGKTFLSIEVIAAAKQKYGKALKWVYDDAESGFSFDTKKLYGFEIMPMDKDKRIKSPTVEDAYCNVREFFEKLKSDEFGIYVIDSLDALNDKEGKKIADDQYKTYKKRKASPTEKEVKEKGSYRMAKAKYLSNTFFPNLADLIEKKNGLLIIISQVRCNLDPFSFEKYSRAGGKAMDFYAHTVLWLANLKKLKKCDRPVGVVVKASNRKSKTPRPYRELMFTLYFDYGLDNITTNVDFLYDLLTNTGLPSSKESITWDDSPKMNRAKMIDYIIDNNLEKELKKRALAKWEAIETKIKTNRKPKYQ